MRNWQLLGYGLLLVALIGCSKGDKPGDNKPGDNKPGDNKAAIDPKSKEAAVIVLKEFYKAADGKEYEKAAAMFIPNPDFDPKQAEKHCTRMLESKEISPKGIEILAEKGKWAKLSDEAKSEREIEKLKEMARAFKAEANSLYVLGMEEREAFAIFSFDGKQFKIVRIDDIGRLEDPAPVRPTPPPGERFTGRIIKMDPASRMVSLKGSVGNGKDKNFANLDFTIPDDVPVTATGGTVKIPAKSLFKYLKDGMLLEIRHVKDKVLEVEVREEIKLDE